MAAATKPEVTRPHGQGPSFVSLLSGWAQQGVQSFFASQRVILDLAMRQNASVMQALRQQLTDPNHSPTMILSEMAGEGASNIIEGQKVLLELAQEQNEILMQGVKEQIGTSPAAQAVADLFQRSVETFIDMQQEFLKMASKQTHAWLNSVKAGKPFDPENLVEMAREGMDTFVHAQKKFLDMVAEETTKATSSRAPTKKVEKTELTEMAREATDAFIEAQKKLMDVAGQQLNVGMRAAGRTMNMVAPFPFIPIPDLTRQGVKTFVDAEKALIDTVMTRPEPKHAAKKTAHRTHKRPRTIKMHKHGAVA